MRLHKLSVEGLFGLFDHEVMLNDAERITILHAPNGFGKTVLLKMIAGMFGGSLAIFRQHEFKNVIFEMNDGTTLVVHQSEGEEDDLFPRDRVSEQRIYTIRILGGGDELLWDPFSSKNIDDMRRDIPMAAFERYVPHLFRDSQRTWRDTRSGEILSVSQVYEKYSDALPQYARRIGRLPEWLETFRSSLHCQFIETQRLVIENKERKSYDGGESPLTPAVKTYAEGLSHLMSRALADSATLSQSLDRTFPNRLLAAMSDPKPPKEEVELRNALSDLEQRRARLTKVDLLDKSDESAVIPNLGFDLPTRRILSEYVNDAKRKLDVYNDLLDRIELFTSILTERFRFKTVTANRARGFIFSDIKGRPLQPDSLSSGEQHELVLIYDLLFKTKRETLLLIDEPEISLHIAWQKKFLDDLRRIIELTPMDVVLSTHSPQLIGSNLHLAVKLKGPTLHE